MDRRHGAKYRRPLRHLSRHNWRQGTGWGGLDCHGGTEFRDCLDGNGDRRARILGSRHSYFVCRVRLCTFGKYGWKGQDNRHTYRDGDSVACGSRRSWRSIRLARHASQLATLGKWSMLAAVILTLWSGIKYMADAPPLFFPDDKLADAGHTIDPVRHSGATGSPGS